ncbi:MAG: hypothetical protein K2W96_21610 [Gemmataceae bacterium]|nr:hypothetical protein [Gemmataceae bacterium]
MGAEPAYRVRLRFPPSNAESCGIDTLYLCARIGDAEGSLRELDEAIPLSRDGASLAALAEAARSRGLRAELLNTDLARLQRWRLPAVLHVDGRHFIGYVGTTDEGRLLLFDNGAGLIDCDPAWFAERYRWRGDCLVVGDVPSPWLAGLLDPWFAVPACAAILISACLLIPTRRPKGALP